MANENMQEFGTSAVVEQETIRAVVQAYAEGKIELEKPKPGAKGGGNKVRLAPSFVPSHAFNDLKSVENPKPYNAESIANFLGWMSGEQGCRIAYITTTGGYRSAESMWPEIQDAMIDAMIRLENALAPHLSNLKSELA